VGVMVKSPSPGEVKTRLSPPFTITEAADMAMAFLADTIAVACQATVETTAEVWCVVAGDTGRLLGALPDEVRVLEQRGLGLGARLLGAFCDLAALGYERSVLVGGDCPTVTRDDLVSSLELLDDHDVVLGPALDGGYVLISAHRPHEELFVGVPMGTDSVLARTLARARESGLRVALLGPRRDLDTAADLADALAGDELAHARRTLGLLSTRAVTSGSRGSQSA
jgi:uncharacterized protein